MQFRSKYQRQLKPYFSAASENTWKSGRYSNFFLACVDNCCALLGFIFRSRVQKPIDHIIELHHFLNIGHAINFQLQTQAVHFDHINNLNALISYELRPIFLPSWRAMLRYTGIINASMNCGPNQSKIHHRAKMANYILTLYDRRRRQKMVAISLCVPWRIHTTSSDINRIKYYPISTRMRSQQKNRQYLKKKKAKQYKNIANVFQARFAILIAFETNISLLAK